MTATIGQTIKKLRKNNGWTQEELAAKLSDEEKEKFANYVSTYNEFRIIPC